MITNLRMELFQALAVIGWCRFDRERREVHHLTVEVADNGGGEGAANTNTAELVIGVADTNDNAPEFSASQYQVSCSRATL